MWVDVVLKHNVKRAVSKQLNLAMNSICTLRICTFFLFCPFLWFCQIIHG